MVHNQQYKKTAFITNMSSKYVFKIIVNINTIMVIIKLQPEVSTPGFWKEAKR